MPESTPDAADAETPPRETREGARAMSGTVTVRYWAAARAAAGRTEDKVDDVETVQQVLDAVRAMRPGDDRFDRVLTVSSVLLGDRPVRRENLAQAQVVAGDVVEVLPPFAGG